MKAAYEFKIHGDTEFNRLVSLLNKYADRLPNELVRELKTFELKPLVIDLEWILQRGYNPPDITVMIDRKRVNGVEIIYPKRNLYKLGLSDLREFKNCKIYHAGKLVFEC